MERDEWNQFLKRIGIFSSLTDKERDLLLEGARELNLRRREVLFEESSPALELYVVRRGSLKTVKGNSKGSRLLLDFVKHGEVVGETAVLLSTQHEADAVSIDSTQVVAIPAHNLKTVLNSQPRLGNALAALSAAKARTYRERLYMNTSLPVHKRVLLTLHMLAVRFGKKEKKETLIALKVTHQDIADYVGASRETVSLCLSRFRREGLIKTRVRRIIVPDLRALKKAALS